MDAINVQDLIKIYSTQQEKSKQALDNLNMKVPMGSIFGLLGSNGAGKSTLINVLAGTVTKTSGLVEIMGVNIDKESKKARSLIGVVPQDIFIDSFFPLYQALEFMAGYYGIRPEDRQTSEILKALNLYDKKDSFPQSLSGGMRRRFLIAKAMVHSPKVLILDEPTAGVDIELRDQLWAYVKKLNAQGVTIIITTHYLAEAQELCDYIAFIDEGKIVKQDLKENILNELGSREVEIEFAEPINNQEFQLKNNLSFQMISDNKLKFELTEDDNLNDILLNINSLGKKIKDIKINEADLEDIFHKIVKK